MKRGDWLAGQSLLFGFHFMRMIKKSNKQPESQQIGWKKRPSEIRGFQRTLYMNTENGDYIRVDYNTRDKKIRLYVEVAEEGGNPYYSVITNGKITAEKSVSTGRSFGFEDKFSSRADVFRTLPQRDAFRLIGNNYGISYSKKSKGPKTEKEELREQTKKRYFKREDLPRADEEEGGGSSRFGINIIDLIDFSIGVIASGGVFYYFQYSYVAMGAVSAFFGIIIGLFDMFIRGRGPVFFKVLFFVLSGIAFYMYGYFL